MTTKSPMLDYKFECYIKYHLVEKTIFIDNPMQLIVFSISM